MKTKERLAKVLRAAGAEPCVVQKALDGVYDDFESELPNPIAQLVNDCEREHLSLIAARARGGEFDATREEAEAWAKGPGAAIVKAAFGGKI